MKFEESQKLVKDKYNSIVDYIVFDMIENIAGIKIGYADPYLTSILDYFDIHSPEYTEFVTEFEDLCNDYDIEYAEYLLEIPLSLIALTFILQGSFENDEESNNIFGC